LNLRKILPQFDEGKVQKAKLFRVKISCCWLSSKIQMMIKGRKELKLKLIEIV
jgi:hypothetical protein